MRLRWFGGQLFWKLLATFWLCMHLSVLATGIWLRYLGKDFPAIHAGQWEFPPVFPLFSMTLAILVASLLLAAYLSRPLRDVRWALDQFAQGNLDIRLGGRWGSRRDEITDLAADFDKMAERVQGLTKARETLIHNVSHELRSPLHRLQTAVGLLKQERFQGHPLLDRIEKEGHCLGALVDELLTLHRLSAGHGQPMRARLDVIDLLEAIAVDADFEARAAGKNVTMTGTRSFVAEVDGDLICRALENVIRNAVKFTAIGSEVEVYADTTQDGKALHVVVFDRGPGVPPDRLEDIFEAFVRIDTTEYLPGVGLGLAIAKQAILLHDGHISATVREGGGLVISIYLPSGSRPETSQHALAA